MSTAALVDHILSQCRALRDESLGLRWEWDERFSAGLAVIKEPEHAAIVQQLDRIFESRWDHVSLDRADQDLQAICQIWGGLRAGQLFFADETYFPVFFACWWPWGGNTTFSLRVSCAPLNHPQTPPDHADIILCAFRDALIGAP